MSERSLAKRLWYDSVKAACQLATVGLFHIRCTGRQNQPRDGGALVLANHQSLFDPVLVGMALDRRLCPLARETLFVFAPFGWLIESLGAIPIDREGSAVGGIKETLRRLKRGEWVLIFPEGTRTFDGEVARLKPGFSALAKRAKVPLLPVGIDGAFDAWPRTKRLPGLSTIHVHVGEPIAADQAAAAGDRELVEEVARRIHECHEIARRGRERAVEVSARRAPKGGPLGTSQ